MSETTLINLATRRGVVPEGAKDAIWYGPGLCEFPTEALGGLKPDILLPVPEDALEIFQEAQEVSAESAKAVFTPIEDAMNEAFGEELAKQLREAGYRSVSQVRGTAGRTLAAIPGVGVDGAKKLKFVAPK